MKRDGSGHRQISGLDAATRARVDGYACGIEVALTSLAQPGVGFGSEADALAMARRCNDYAADLAARWPRRFGAFATVPMGTPQGALDEILMRSTC